MTDSSSTSGKAAVRAYKQSIERWTESLLQPYIRKIRTARVPSTKEINDAVWQTILLYPFEVVILDSPILQRLRQIKQLGVVHWTYPCAVHSRLEHSIGAMLQVQRLVDAMNNHPAHRSNSGGTGIQREWLNLLRLAALCHDVGHGLMSHVSENALRLNTQAIELNIALRESFHRNCSLSEAAAYFILGSKAFRELIRTARTLAGKHELPDDAIKPLQNAVIGETILNDFPLLQEIISGPFDADKLDYMNRDAYATGVPTVTDVSRLVQKARLVAVSPDKLPEEIGKRLPCGQTLYNINAISLSGGRTLDELMLGRTLLFDKVYRHQKVRAAEAMVAIIVDRLAAILGDRAPMLPLLIEDECLLGLDRAILGKKLGVTITSRQWTVLKPARELANRLLQRNLFVRAYSFSHHLPNDPFRADSNQDLGIESLTKKAMQPESREIIQGAIRAELGKMQRCLRRRLAPGVTSRQLKYLFALDPPAPANDNAQIARAYLVSGDGNLMPFRKESPETSGIFNAYPLARDVGYVFSTPEISEAVFLACEKVFRRLYQIRTPASALDYAKLPSDRVRDLRMKLTRRGFYIGCPNDLRAEPERLRRADVDAKIKTIVQNLSTFEGLSYTADDGKIVAARVDEARVRTWLRQFTTEGEAEEAITLLLAIKMVGRNEVLNAVDQFIKKYPKFRDAYVCPLGSPRDSSGHLTYYIEDLNNKHAFELSALQDALLGKPKPIVFVDDFVGSGKQIQTIFYNWFDRAGEAPLEEDHGPSLDSSLQSKLKQRSVGFVFASGDPVGALKAVSKAKDEFGMDAVSYVNMDADDLPRAFARDVYDLDSGGLRSNFRGRCEDIGRQLLKTRPGRRYSKRLIEQRVLGYGNKGYLVAFPYNVPTQTLTLLWCGGKVDGWDWLPLLPRRSKT